MRMDESRVKREIDEHHSHGSQSIRSLGCALDGETKVGYTKYATRDAIRSNCFHLLKIWALLYFTAQRKHSY